MSTSDPSPGSSDLLGSLLRGVSRSFYLTLRVLPGAMREPVGLAYLLARATDTVADTEVVSPELRLETLAELGRRIQGVGVERLDLGRYVQPQGTVAERVLLERFEEAIGHLERMAAADCDLIREVLAVIVSGQELDLRRFGGRSGDEVRCLASGAELEDYAYRVAGCVGVFWTRMTVRHFGVKPGMDEARMLDWGKRFGQGLQLVNILRDLASDLRMGRCYLPEDELCRAGLAARDLLDVSNESRLRPVYDRWLGVAEEHLEAGWRYTNALPGHWLRLRLACAWPVLIGIRTLGRLRAASVLDPGMRIKITRAEVRQVMLGSLVRLPFRGAWEGQFRSANGDEW